MTRTGEGEDFAHKYTEEGQRPIGKKLIDGYFRAVKELVEVSKISQRQGVEAMEIGCGEGFSTQRLRGILPAEIPLAACDHDDELVSRAAQNNPTLTISTESIYALQRADNSVPLVFLLEVLEHLEFPGMGLAELRRIVEPGGYAVIGVPREPLWCALNMARGKYVKSLGNTPGHLNHWSSRGMKRYIEGSFGQVLAMRQPIPWTIVLAQKSATEL